MTYEYNPHAPHFNMDDGSLFKKKKKPILENSV